MFCHGRRKKIRNFDIKISQIFIYFSVSEEKEDPKEEVREDRTEKKDEDCEEGSTTVTCPLCQEGFKDKETLEDHAMTIHSINAEGLQRLMMLMQGSHWLNNAKNNKEEESGSILYFFY